MVNAATDIQYGNDFYKSGSILPGTLVEEFERTNPSLLDNHIEINGKWIKITDKKIVGMVEERKTEFKRLRDFFKIPFVERPLNEVLNLPKKEKVADRTPEEVKAGQNEATATMEKIKTKEKKAPPKEKIYSEKDLRVLSFSKLRKIGYQFRPKIRERSIARLIKQILKAQNAR